jgi:hypothetical protein
MSRIFRHRLLAGLGAAIAVMALPLYALADTALSARGWTHDRFGRLVFDRAARLVTGVEVQDRKLVITFSEPVSIDLTGALRFLNTYVGGPKAAQGRSIELDLLQPVTLERWVEESKFVVDLRPVATWAAVGTAPAQTGANTQASATPKTGAPKAEAPRAETPKTGAPTSAAPKTEAPKPGEPRIIKPGSGTTTSPTPANAAGAPPKIVARHGEHGTFMRLAIDWPSRIGYHVERDGDRIEVAFTAPGNIDLARARRDLPKELAQIAAVNDTVARIYLTLAPGASLRDFRIGRTVVLDIMRPVKPAGTAPELRLPDKAPDARQASATQTMPAVPEAPKVPNTIAALPAAPPPAVESAQPRSAPAPQFSLQSLPALPQPAPTPAPASGTSRDETSTAETPAPQPEQPKQVTQSQPPPMPEIEQAVLPPRAPVDVQVRVAPAENGTKIMFAWP